MLREVVYLVKSRGPRTEPWGDATGGCIEGRDSVITSNTEGGR